MKILLLLLTAMFLSANSIAGDNNSLANEYSNSGHAGRDNYSFRIRSVDGKQRGKISINIGVGQTAEPADVTAEPATAEPANVTAEPATVEPDDITAECGWCFWK